MPSDSRDAALGVPVRVHLEPPGSVELPGLTAHDVERVDGEFITRDPRRLFLSATWLDAVGGRGFPGGGWTVRVERDTVRRFEVRRISWLRTGVVFAVLAVGTYFGFESLLGSGGEGGRSGGGGRTR